MTESPNFISQALPINTWLVGKYRIESLLGKGGFAYTYKAYHKGFESYCAIKEFFPDGSSRATDFAVHPTNSPSEVYHSLYNRFNEEAKNLFELKHPGIVRVFDLFEANGTIYYAMDLIDGYSIGDVMRNYRHKPFELEQAIEWVQQVGEALQYVHEQKMYHRDVKPDNLMVNRKDKQIILIDFGLTRGIHIEGTQHMTRAFTAGYAPPEQESGKGHIGPQLDVYALAATLYHLLTGQLPETASARMASFIESGGDSLKSAHEVLESVPESVSRVIDEAMRLQTKERTPTIQKFLEDLSLSLKTRRTPSQAGTKTIYAGPWRDEDQPGTKTIYEGPWRDEDSSTGTSNKTEVKGTENDQEQKKDLKPEPLPATEVFPEKTPTTSSEVSSSGKLIWISAVCLFLLGGGFVLWQFVMPSQIGQLTIQSNIAEANIFLNNQLQTPSPATFPLTLDTEWGPYHIRIEKPGYRNYQTEIELNRDKMVVQADLQKALAQLVVQSEVSGAALFVNDQPYGSLPQELDLEWGLYQIRVEKSGHQTFRKDLELKGQKVVVSAKLPKAKSRLTVDANVENALVFVDNQASGSVPQELDLAWDSYQIRVEKKGYQPYRETVELKGEAKMIQAELTKKTGRLLVKSNVSASKVFINNEAVGATPVEVMVEWSVYEIKVEKYGYAPFQQTIELESETREIFAKLEPIRRECIFSENKRNYANCNFSGADLRGDDLKDADLNNANLERANLKGADLRGANLTNANLKQANLERAKLLGSQLDGTDFWKANLRYINLKGMNLQKTNFQDADLEYVNLNSARLDVKNMLGANLDGADMNTKRWLRNETCRYELDSLKKWVKCVF